MSHKGVPGILELIPYGIYVAAAPAAEGTAAIVVTWISQVSFKPPLIALSLEGNGAFVRHVETAGEFSLNLLGKGGKPVAQDVLRGKGLFESGAGLFRMGEPGAPALEGALATLWCGVRQTVAAGDHVVVIAEVLRGEQLHRGQILTLADTGWKYRAPGDT